MTKTQQLAVGMVLAFQSGMAVALGLSAIDTQTARIVTLVFLCSPAIYGIYLALSVAIERRMEMK